MLNGHTYFFCFFLRYFACENSVFCWNDSLFSTSCRMISCKVSESKVSRSHTVVPRRSRAPTARHGQGGRKQS